MNVFTTMCMRLKMLPSLRILCVAILAATMLMVTANLSAQNVILDVTRQGQTLGQVLPAITQQTGMEFSYKVDMLDTPISSSGTTLTGSVREVLDKLLADTGIEYTISDNRIFFAKTQRPAAAVVPTRSVAPQSYTLTGTVRSTDGEPLIGVIVAESASNAAVSDSDGKFTLQVGIDSQITFSYIDYETVTENVAGRTVMNVTMTAEATELDDVVVVGYRTVKKISLIGSVATIDMSQKENQAMANAAQALYNTPGVWINQAGAKPGRENASIRVQGINSLNTTGQGPLILLDGVEYDINEIDPSTIENISVLKDVSAAIYGNRGTNGVILITSKKGAKGKPRIDYKGMAGIQMPTVLPDIVTDPILYMKLRNQAEINSGVNPEAVNYTPAQIAEYEAGMKVDPSVYPASDWLDILTRIGYMQQHSLRLSGGGDAVVYSMGLGVTDQSGILIANDAAQRYSYDIKLDAQVSKRLKVSGTFQGNFRTVDEPYYGIGTVMNTLFRGLPIFSDYHKNGLYGSSWLFTPGRNNIENPRMQVEQGSIYRELQELLSTVSVDWNITDNLKYFATESFRKYDHFSKNFTPHMMTIEPKTGVSKMFVSDTPRVQDWDALYRQLVLSHRLVWEKTFAEKHNMHVMVGNEYKDYKSRAFTAYNNRFNDGTLSELDALKDMTNARVTGSSSFSREISVFGRAAYTYDDKYLAEVTMRYDGSSRLAPGHRWAFFPSVMLGWRIDREGFFDVPAINMLKLRVSAGTMGSPSVGNYAYQMTYTASSTNYSFGESIASGYAVGSLTDETLTWERTASYNIGIDIAALRNRLTFEGNVFYKRTNDIIMTVSIPSHVGGLGGPKSNIGEMQNKGFEIAAGWRDRIRNFTYGVNGSVGFFRNKVLHMNVDQIVSGNTITKVGYPINSFYLYQEDGYFQSLDEINDTPVVYGTRQNLRPGYLRYKNINKDDVIDEKDKIITGSTIPELTYSFGINIGWKDLFLEAQFQGVGNSYVYLGNNISQPFYNGAGVTTDWSTESWTPSNPNSRLPLLTIPQTATENFIASTKWLHNTRYLRMKNIQLTYNFPKQLIGRIGIERLQIFVSGQNLLTFSPFKLWDPEISTNAGNIFQYPNMKTVSMGLNITF